MADFMVLFVVMLFGVQVALLGGFIMFAPLSTHAVTGRAPYDPMAILTTRQARRVRAAAAAPAHDETRLAA